jgi:hypothetical protein
MTGVGQVGDRASRADRGQWSSDLHGSSADPRLPPRLLVAEEGRGIMLLKLFWLNSSVGLARGSNNMCAWRRSAVRTQRPTETRKTTTLMNMAGFDVREIHCQPEQCRKRAPHGCVRHTETCANCPNGCCAALPGIAMGIASERQQGASGWQRDRDEQCPDSPKLRHRGVASRRRSLAHLLRE